jgi:hypothetical protein
MTRIITVLVSRVRSSGVVRRFVTGCVTSSIGEHIVTQRAVKVTVAVDAGVVRSEVSETGGLAGLVLVVVVGESAGEVTVFVEGSDGGVGEGGWADGGTGSVLEEIVTQ